MISFRLGLYLYLFIFGEEIAVPNVVGMTLEEANKTLDSGLTMSIKPAIMMMK